MQAVGIAEADPSLDVDGWDAAAKAAALANVLMGAGVTPHDVKREGIGRATAERAARRARATGCRLGLGGLAPRRRRTAPVVRTGGACRPAILLAGLRGTANAPDLHTDLLGASIADLPAGRRVPRRPPMRCSATGDRPAAARPPLPCRHAGHRRRNAPPLAGLTVLDFTRVLSGPYCTMLLADMGRASSRSSSRDAATTRARGGRRSSGAESAYFLSVNRNKESLTLDLKSTAARAVARAAARHRPTSSSRTSGPARWRVSASTTPRSAARRPRIVYCSISGFGQTGPRRDEAGYDAVMQAEGGLMSITGERVDRPFRLGVAISDIVTGMFAFQGIAMALLARTRSGQGAAGRRRDARRDGRAAHLSGGHLLRDRRRAPARIGNRHPTIVPYETFAASDGEFRGRRRQRRAVARVLRACGLDALGDDPRFATQPAACSSYERSRRVIAARLQDADSRGVDRGAQRRRRAVRLGARCRRSAAGSADRGAGR